MQVHGFWEKYGNYIAVALTVICNIILISHLFGCYYDLNDDVLIKDIMAGVYTGTPEAHNMQTLYVLGFLISLLYRLYRRVPWYGLFLCLCQFGSLYLVGVRLLRLCRKKVWKGIWLIMLTLFVWSVILFHMAAVQYTVTCGIMAATAIFLFVTTEREISVKTFWFRNIPSVLLIIFAFQLRSEMLLLLFPMVALAGFFCWLEEKNFFQKENIFKYCSVFGTIVLGMVCSLLIDSAAYSSPEWRSFRNFFDDRTEVYDFHYDILTDGTHTKQLAEFGFSESAQKLLANYNYGLDETIDEFAMQRLADYAKEYASGNTDIRALLLKKAGQYRYRILHLQDGPYSILMLFGYCMVFGAGVFATVAYRDKKSLRFLIEALLLIAVRTVLWLYILLRGRDPVRITHPLYLVEFAVLMGMVYVWLGGVQHRREQLTEPVYKKQKMKREYALYLLAGIWIIALFSMMPGNIKSAVNDISQKHSSINDARTIAEYCKEHADSFYFEDVYSTVSFSQRMFQDADNSITNYDIMGGWICKSPLYEQKLEYFGMTSMAEGLLYGERIYLIMEDASPENSTDWLEAYYMEQGISIEIDQVDFIGKYYGVYQVREAEK